jgi:TolA-binding protein
MKLTLSVVLLALAAAVGLRAQESELPSPSLAQPEVQVSEPKAADDQLSVQAEELPEAKTEEPKAEPKPEPKAEPKPEPKAEPKPEPKPEPKAEPAPVPAPVAEPKAKAAKKAPKQLSSEEILAGVFQVLKSGAEDPNAELRGAALESLRVFIQQNPDAASAPEALAILARAEDFRPAMVDWLHLVYEYPQSSLAIKAKSEYLDLVNKKMSGKLKPGLSALAKSPDSEDKAERLAKLVYDLAERSGDALYDAAAAEIRRFQVRFPGYKDNDRILWSLAQLHLGNNKYAAALMTYRELLAYQGSAYREKAQFATAELFADKLKRYRDAVDAYQAFLEQYPDSLLVPEALQRAALLYADRLDQAPLAIETYERVIKLYPKTESALKAFKAQAKLQRDRLKDSDAAIKTYVRITEQFRYPQAAEALMAAADLARRDLKDYKREVELRSKIAEDFPLVKEAPEQLYQAAEVLEEDLKDLDSAVKMYQDVASKFASSKQGRKAGDRANKLLQKKG